MRQNPFEVIYRGRLFEGISAIRLNSRPVLQLSAPSFAETSLGFRIGNLAAKSRSSGFRAPPGTFFGRESH
jgi:hypothetical protein